MAKVKYKNDQRQYEELEHITAGIIEAVGEDRLLEHIVQNMDKEERRELGEELRSTKMDLANQEQRERYMRTVVADLSHLSHMHNEETADDFRMGLIWAMAKGRNDGEG